MASKAKREALLLGVLVVTLVSALAYNLRGALPSDSSQAPERQQAGPRGGGAGQTGQPETSDLQLERLAAARTEPSGTGRNPFRLGARMQPSAPSSTPQPNVPADAPAPGPPPGPPPPPPIPLKFIGIVSAPEPTGRLAVLSDGKFVYQGREGEVVEGRYRIVRIGVESIEMEHVDGRGRQTIRLTGS